MRKLLLMMLILAISLIPSVCAETAGFTLPFADAAPVTSSAGLPGITAVARGKTIVLRISDAWMEKQSLTAPSGFQFGTSADETEEAILPTKMFTDVERTNFMNIGDAFGYNKVNVYRAGISDADNDLLLMNNRHMDGCWYAIIRPEDKFSDTYSLQMAIFNVAVTMENDELSSIIESQTLDATYTLNIQSANKSEEIFDKSGGDLRMIVFNELGANIAVVYEKGASSDEAEYALLTIEGLDSAIELSGYRDGSKAVYCCVLSDSELQALQNGASIRLAHDK